MPINISCPICSRSMHAPVSAAGRNIRCPDCHAAVAVPGDGGVGESRLTPAGRQKLVLGVAVAIVFGVLLFAVSKIFFK